MVEAIVEGIPQDEALVLFGQRDENLRTLRDGLGLKVIARGGRLTLRGPEDLVDRGLRVIEQLRGRYRTRRSVDSDDVRMLLEGELADETELVDVGVGGGLLPPATERGDTAALAPNAPGPEEGPVADEPDPITGSVSYAASHASPPIGTGRSGGSSGGKAVGGGSLTGAGGRRLRPRTPGQAAYLGAIGEHDLTFCVGPAGTGKTYLAVAAALEALLTRRVKKLVLTRPAVEAGEKLGFLPGDMQAKVNPYLRPLLDALRDMLDFQQVREYLDNDVVEIVPLAFMRGRTLNDSFIILDEAQNTTVPQMQMFLTRMGMGSHVVVTGDITQVDLPHGTRNGLEDAIARLRRIDKIAVVEMRREDIVRNPLVQQIVQAYDREPSTSAPGPAS